jgi:hypothetical protein
MLSKPPEVAADRYGWGFYRRETVVWIRLIESLQSVDQDIDLGHLEAGHLEIEV